MEMTLVENASDKQQGRVYRDVAELYMADPDMKESPEIVRLLRKSFQYDPEHYSTMTLVMTVF